MFKLRALQKFKQLLNTPLKAPTAPTFSAAAKGDSRFPVPFSREFGTGAWRPLPGVLGTSGVPAGAPLPRSRVLRIRLIRNVLILAFQKMFPSVDRGKTHVAISESDR